MFGPRVLRRRSVLAVIFGCSVIYFTVNIIYSVQVGSLTISFPSLSISSTTRRWVHWQYHLCYQYHLQYAGGLNDNIIYFTVNIIYNKQVSSLTISASLSVSSTIRRWVHWKYYLGNSTLLLIMIDMLHLTTGCKLSMQFWLSWTVVSRYKSKPNGLC